MDPVPTNGPLPYPPNERGTSVSSDDHGSAFWWSVEEAREQAASQLGASACGPTALLDVLRLLGLAGPDTNREVLKMVPARTRDYSASLL